MSLIGGPSPRWFAIAAHRPFLDDLAYGLHHELVEPDPQGLADAVVLTPTRRGARALIDSFVKAGRGRALLLPQILALGDLDEGEPPFEPGDLALDLAPAISPLHRRFELTRLVQDNAVLFEQTLDAASAMEIADALGEFLDAVQIEEINPGDKLATLVDGDFALHWKRSADVLRLATEHWPRRLAELGLLDVNQRRTALLRALAEQWTRNPPDRPLIAAGSMGTAPATADLLLAIANAPKGAVVLPGLDLDLAEEAWVEVEDAHPQGAMKRLLIRASLSRKDVRSWPALEDAGHAMKGRARRRLINEALRPPDATADWLRIIADLSKEGAASGYDPIAQGLDGLSVVSARNEEAAASLAALFLRETLETPGKTAALITPDAAMARRVSARLGLWGVEADSSAGRPLIHYPTGVLMTLVARAAAQPLSPAETLSILKHPLVRLGWEESALASSRRHLERYGFRGPRPPDWADVADRLTAARTRAAQEVGPGSPNRVRALEGALQLANDLALALKLAASVFSQGEPWFCDAAEALGRALEALGRDPSGQLGDLWRGAGGQAAAACLASLIRESGARLRVDAREFSEVTQTIVAQHLVRTGGANHPRLRILGALEARLVRADRLILAGLEEGVWPAAPQADPFLSRPMREKLGLPPPERRVGLAAHDFSQAACAPEVTLISTERRGGQPAVKSRWLWRVETLVRGAGLKLPRRLDLEAWATALESPIDPRPAELRSAERPAPKPPREARPRRLPVTRIETWVRDPYAVYAREILGLRLLDRPDAEMAAWRRGTAIHRVFQLFAEAFPRLEPQSAPSWFADHVVRELRSAGFSEAAMAREKTLAERLGDWWAPFEQERRSGLERLLVEGEGALVFNVDGRPFTVTAKADRIELGVGPEGPFAHILDFKTGPAPSALQVQTGFSPQLSLTAAILKNGGFTELGAPQPQDLLYVRAMGRRLAGEIKSAVGKDETSTNLADAALNGLIRRVARFDDPKTPYLAWTAPQFLSQRRGDFDHLSRLYEWHVMGEDGEEGGGE